MEEILSRETENLAWVSDVFYNVALNVNSILSERPATNLLGTSEFPDQKWAIFRKVREIKEFQNKSFSPVCLIF